MNPEERVKVKIEALLKSAGWKIQERKEINLGVPVVFIDRKGKISIIKSKYNFSSGIG